MTVVSSHPYVHEAFCPLSWAPIYHQLNHEEKIRYNQLSGLMFNEQFMVFEGGCITRILETAGQQPACQRVPGLLATLHRVHAEEQQHQRMFKTFNKHAAPDIYRSGHRYFIHLTYWQRRLMHLLAAQPGLFGLTLRVISEVERFSCRMAEALIDHAGDHQLGPIDANYRQLHQKHLLDEAQHVEVDATVLDCWQAGHSPATDRLQQWCARRLLADIATPKRATMRIIDRLVEEHPRLRRRHQDLRQAVRSVGRDPRYRSHPLHPAQAVWSAA